MIFFSSFRWIFGLPRATSWYGVALIKTSFRLETFSASNLLQTHPFVEGWKREKEREGEKKKIVRSTCIFFLVVVVLVDVVAVGPPFCNFQRGTFYPQFFYIKPWATVKGGGVGKNIFFVVEVFNVQKELARDGGREKARCNYIIHRRIRILIRYKARLHARCGVSSRCQILLSAAHSALWTSLFRLDIVIQCVPVIAVQSSSM